MLDDLISADNPPQMLFEVERPRDARLMTALDAVNDRWGMKNITAWFGRLQTGF